MTAGRTARPSERRRLRGNDTRATGKTPPLFRRQRHSAAPGCLWKAPPAGCTGDPALHELASCDAGSRIPHRVDDDERLHVGVLTRRHFVERPRLVTPFRIRARDRGCTRAVDGAVQVLQVFPDQRDQERRLAASPPSVRIDSQRSETARKKCPSTNGVLSAVSTRSFWSATSILHFANVRVRLKLLHIYGVHSFAKKDGCGSHNTAVILSVPWPCGASARQASKSFSHTMPASPLDASSSRATNSQAS